MSEAALVIMAAGMGTRFGGGVKQLEPVGLCGETIMDYSIHDAIEAGFDKIVFVIRKDIEASFKSIIGDRIEQECTRLGVTVEYAYQSIEAIPRGTAVPKGRAKPWGTGQAVLSAKALIREPFAVINADDYYGKEAFRKLYDFLTEQHTDTEFCMAGFVLKNTLSDHGGVTRGICRAEKGMLADIVETSGIVKSERGILAGGKAVDPDAMVSMNMWGLMPEFMNELEAGFEKFFQTTVEKNPLTAEYLLPDIIGKLLKAGRCTVKVLLTEDRWFGMTHKADTNVVMEHFRKLIGEGKYPSDLYSDLTGRIENV